MRHVEEKSLFRHAGSSCGVRVSLSVFHVSREHFMRNRRRSIRILTGATCALIFGAAMLLTQVTTRADSPDSKGTDFWVMFNSNLGTPALTLFITGDVATTGTVAIPGLAVTTPFSIVPGTVTSVPITATAAMVTADGTENKAIHITANAEVTVYGLNRIQATTDAYLGLPTDILGTDYIVLTYTGLGGAGSQLGVVATANVTTVTITPSVTTGARVVGVPYNVVLNQGQAYQLRNNTANTDLTGTLITSDKPIAVFGGNQCANVPVGVSFCDHLVEEIPPTNTWGKSFVTMPLATRTLGDTFRVLASSNNTSVFVNSVFKALLNKGQKYEQIITGPATITADNPVLVAQYSNGTSFDGVTSDPFMMLIPPFEQFLNGYTVTTPASGFALNFINVVAPSAAVGSTTLDGVAIPAAGFTPIGASGFSGAQRAVSLGSHRLAGPLPFGVFVYGFADFDSYGYPGGLALGQVASVTTISLTPLTATGPVNTQHCVTAAVTDQNALPLSGIRVDFTVQGVNPGTGFAFTDAAGHAQFCYVGTVVGQDLISGAVGTVISNVVVKTWVPQANRPPACGAAVASFASMYPLDHGLRTGTIVNVTDPDDDPVSITINGICQDERPNFENIAAYAVDGTGVNTPSAAVRAEFSGTRAAPSNGRVYHIYFTGDDGRGGTCTGEVKVGVPTSANGVAVDGGPLYDSTKPNDAACIVPPQ
jgi:hypothetical protein